MGLFDDETGSEDPLKPVRVIRSYLALAIQLGAPAYNTGDHRGCYEVYACTARMLVHAVGGAEPLCNLLRSALERCALVSDINEAAWILRRAFDAVLDDTRDN